MKIELISYTPDGENMIANLAKATRMSRLDMKQNNKDNNMKFIKHLIKIGHLGILEHITFTFHVSEISRCLTHQLVRHRIASYLQMSGRHTKPIPYSEGQGYVIPPSVYKPLKERYGEVNQLYENAIVSAYDYYNRLIKQGVPVEDARYVLPPAFYTHIAITMNARTLRHFFELRCDEHSQWEIREMAKEMLKICYDKYPVIFEDLKEKYDG